jgi:hypothetical protein
MNQAVNRWVFDESNILQPEMNFSYFETVGKTDDEYSDLELDSILYNLEKIRESIKYK